MHSSRMRTVRFNGNLYGGGGGVSAQGVCVSRCVGGGCLGDVSRVVSVQGGVYISTGLRGRHPPDAEADPLPPREQSDRYKNITIPQLRLRKVKNIIQEKD